MEVFFFYFILTLSIFFLTCSTDEQAPIPDVFDQLIHRMHGANQGVDVLFNCQMGYSIIVKKSFHFINIYILIFI